MALICDNSSRRFQDVTNISISIGDETVKHNFGRPVSMTYARAWALHYVNVFTGLPSEFRVGDVASHAEDGKGEADVSR